MNEVHFVSLSRMTNHLADFQHANVATGESQIISLSLLCWMGAHFPGVSACLPTVVFSLECEQALAIHIGSPGSTAKEISGLINSHKEEFGTTLPWQVYTARVIGSNEANVAMVPGRQDNLNYLAQNAILQNIQTPSSALQLSFRPREKFCIVEYTD